MQYRHANKDLKKFDEDPDFDRGLAVNLVKAFRMRMQAIRSASNENDLPAMKSLHFEKLKGKRKNEYSIRLNDSFRLILQMEKTDEGNRIVVLDIENDH